MKHVCQLITLNQKEQWMILPNVPPVIALPRLPDLSTVIHMDTDEWPKKTKHRMFRKEREEYECGETTHVYVEIA